MPDQRIVLDALRLLVQVDERRARLLGLDAPKRQMLAVVPESVIDEEIDRLSAEIAEREKALGIGPAAIEAGGSS